jgi:hypothetical protein
METLLDYGAAIGRQGDSAFGGGYWRTDNEKPPSFSPAHERS